MQPPARARYSPCLASPAATFHVATDESTRTLSNCPMDRAKVPARTTSGAVSLLLFAEVFVAVAARLVHCSDLILDSRLVTGLGDRDQLTDLALQAVFCFLVLRRLRVYSGQRRTFNILGVWRKSVPRHLA